MYGGSRGAKAWTDAYDTWVEYGNPHSTMGQGDLEEYQVDFLVSGKKTFDWLDESNFVQFTPYDSNGYLKSLDSGPFLLYPTDTGGTLVAGGIYGLQIATADADTYFYVEYRTSSTLGDAALITWSPVEYGHDRLLRQLGADGLHAGNHSVGIRRIPRCGLRSGDVD
jgi:hypothetical protein